MNRKSLLKCQSLHLKRNRKAIFQNILEEIFRLADIKSLSLRRAAFEMQLSHSVWGSPIKRPLLSLVKQVLVCSEEGQKRSFTSRRIFFKQRKL